MRVPSRPMVPLFLPVAAAVGLPLKPTVGTEFHHVVPGAAIPGSQHGLNSSVVSGEVATVGGRDGAGNIVPPEFIPGIGALTRRLVEDLHLAERVDRHTRVGDPVGNHADQVAASGCGKCEGGGIEAEISRLKGKEPLGLEIVRREDLHLPVIDLAVAR